MENVLPRVLAALGASECIASDVEGMTSAKTRLLLNRLVGELPSDEAYFEVGIHKGATFVSALLDHRGVAAYGNDNWSEFGGLDSRKIFLDNTERYKDRLPNFKVFETDAFELSETTPFDKPIGVYFYDGHHSMENQKRAITSFAKHLASKCIVLVDDWNLDGVRRGTWDGINAIRPNHVYYTELPKSSGLWWEGVGAFYLELNPVGSPEAEKPVVVPATVN